MPNAIRPALVAGLATLLLAGCSSSTAPGSDTLTVRGSASAPPAAAPASLGAPRSAPPEESGDPAALTIGMYALYISAADDCTNPVLVDDYGATAQYKDFVQNPVLFTGNPPAGVYRCVALKMSDVLRMKPATSFGPCVAGTEYSGDIYREGETDWIDVHGNPIIGTGTEDVPSDDRVTVFLTRDTAAAMARGVSSHQIVQLRSDLVVPASSTFYWNGQGSVQVENGRCSILPGAPEFR